ncbi:MAG: hypothetical protein G8237_11110 [Magnetococcales bacterium]|nr:hypothetical protein [Magnetococcales bacterium]NGZ06892.1 hypothetical protein [Magnetococcales bacterium]
MSRKSVRAGMTCWMMVWLLWAASPLLALDARPALSSTAALERIRLVEHAPCGADRLLVEELFRVTGVDVADLLMVRAQGAGEVRRVAVTGVERDGRLVYAYCAARGLNERVESRFLTVRGDSTPPVVYTVTTAGQSLEKTVTPLLGLHQVTRYMQFADPEQPAKKGTCCWHHLYVKYPWHKAAAEVDELEIPMRFDAYVKPERHHLYYMFSSELNGIDFYFGVQTNLKLRGTDHGVGAIFSRWDTQSGEDLKIVSGGFSEIGDYEGKFVSVRKPVVLESAPMALRLTRRSERTDPKHVWLDFSLVHRTDGVKREEAIGSLRFPGEVARLTKRVKITVESYSLRSVSRASAWRVPFFDWWLEAPRVNGQTVAVKPEVAFPELAPRVVRVVPWKETGLRIRRTGLIDPDGELDDESNMNR